MDTVIVEVTTVVTGAAVLAFTSYLLLQVLPELRARDHEPAPKNEPVRRPRWKSIRRRT